jgi:hypothetical protein
MVNVRATLDKGSRARSNEIEHSYWSRVLNWSQGFLTRVQDQNKSNCDLT